LLLLIVDWAGLRLSTLCVSYRMLGFVVSPC
jgi:hypothetical protein